MTPCDGTKLLTRMLKHFLIGLGAFALMLLGASISGMGSGAGLAEVAQASGMATSEVVNTLHIIDAEFALSEPVYRGTDRGDALLILASAFAGIVAFNLWFFRHLRCLLPLEPKQR
jgi:hypothetical protein